MAENEQVKKLIKRYERLNADKAPWHSHWDDLARVMLPRRLGFASTTIEGERRTEGIFDGTPMQAARSLANAIGGMLRPEGLPEIEMKAENDDLNDTEEVRAWLEDSERRLKAAFNNPRARYRQASGEADQDLVVFGTLDMFVGESSRRNNLLFQTVHLKDAVVFFNEEGPEGHFRKRRMPIRQVISQFGEGKLSEGVRKKAEKDPDQKIDILHVVVPRENARPGAMLARNLPIADYWIEMDAKHLISEGGFHEFPFIVARWDTSSGEDYGRSPGMIALPDADTLQAMGETILIAGQRMADPPLAVPNDGSFDAINTFPGGLAYYDIETAAMLKGRSPFFPIESGGNLPIERDMQLDMREQIWAAFFRNILNLPTEGPQMTATEVIQRKEEFMREIGPVFGRLETDYTAPTVERAFMIMLRNGGFAPIPEVLQGQNIRFEYDSPVIRIRKQIESQAARMWIGEQIEIATATGRPDTLDLVNFDEHARIAADALGIPKTIVNGEDIVAGIRKSRQEAQAAEAQRIAEAEATAMAGEEAKIMEAASRAQQAETTTR